MSKSVYLITDGEYTKIGYSRNPESRLSSLQTGNPRTLTLIAAFQGDERVENRLHRTFQSKNVGGEWFALSKEDVQSIAQQFRLVIDTSRVPDSVDSLLYEHSDNGDIMREYGPIKRGDGRFDYTCRNHMQVWAVGYCQGWEDIPKHRRSKMGMSDDLYERLVENKDKFHEDGHETFDEACECYREYVLDVLLDLEGQLTDMQKRCEVCSDWTQGVAKVSMLNEEIILCDEHRTRHVVDELLPEIGYRTEPE